MYQFLSTKIPRLLQPIHDQFFPQESSTQSQDSQSMLQNTPIPDRFDVKTGRPLDPKTGNPYPIDPETSQPFNPQKPSRSCWILRQEGKPVDPENKTQPAKMPESPKAARNNKNNLCAEKVHPNPDRPEEQREEQLAKGQVRQANQTRVVHGLQRSKKVHS